MIRVNGKEFDASAVFATDGSMSMTFKTTESLNKVEAYFPASVTIEVVENNIVTAKYYNKRVESIKAINTTPRTVTVVLRVSELQEDAEEEINGRIDTSDGAVEELAIMAADHEDRITVLEEQIAALIGTTSNGTTEAETEANNG